MISDLMIELELPILKARSRDEYAMEQEMSPWSIGMLPDKENFKNTKRLLISVMLKRKFR